MNYVTSLRKIEKAAKPVVRMICIYEFVALTAPKNKYTPTVSSLLNRHKWLMPVFFGTIAAHAWWLDS